MIIFITALALATISASIKLALSIKEGIKLNKKLNELK